MKGVTPLRDVSKVIAQYQSLKASIFRQVRLALHDFQGQLDVWQRQWMEWLSQAEVKANKLIGAVQDSIRLQIRRVLNYKDTILAGFTVLGDTIKGKFLYICLVYS